MNKRTVIIAILLIILFAVIGVILILPKNKKQNEVNNVQIIDNSQIISEIKSTDNPYIGELDDGTKISTNANMNEPSIVENFEFKNIRLTLKNGITTFRTNVTNIGTEKTELKSVTLTLLDGKKEKIVSASGVISAIDAGASTELSISITSNYVNAEGYKITFD